jgi:hypothetical protein
VGGTCEAHRPAPVFVSAKPKTFGTAKKSHEKILQSRIGLAIVDVRASRRDLFGCEGDVEVVVKVAGVRRYPGEAPTHALADFWGPIIRGVSLSLWAIVRKRGHPPALNPQGGRFGLPADFLIARDGRVLACKYGDHVYDQWGVISRKGPLRTLKATNR